MIDALPFLIELSQSWKAGSDWQVRFYRDQQRVHDRVRSRIRVYQFETRLAREAFGSLLSSYREDD